MGKPEDSPPTRDDFYLPDLCTATAALGVVLIAELVAICFTLARQPAWDQFFVDLAKTSLLLLWIGLTAAAVLCGLRGRLARYPIATASLLTFAAVMLVIAVISEVVWLLGQNFDTGWFPREHAFFLSRNLALGALVTGVILRYLYIAHQWRRNVEGHAESRIHALQARIRPHFLFNSMNTIADLTRSNPAAAERAVEDLADLFRASLRDGKEMVRLDQELEITRVYERMEKQRLGERLHVNWDTAELPADARIPGLTLQPLLENAIYHGIERLPDPGAVEVEGRRKGDMLYLSVRNPLPVDKLRSGPGNRIAVDNIRERLQLAFGQRARLSTAIDATHYQVSIAIPYST
ncbi:MAG: histidine kinase [Gammaproteobacteria bacterium]|nr:histidine kinase [Gammaproteobacteria bacterium]